MRDLPNYNYNRGRAREYQVIFRLRALGWVCTRSAMSHGPVDVIAAKKGRVRLIQVKSGSARISNQEIRLLKVWARAFKADAEIWYFRERGKPEIDFVVKQKLISKLKSQIPLGDPSKSAVETDLALTRIPSNPISQLETQPLPSSAA
jgi:Holliday junction resolvase